MSSAGFCCNYKSESYHFKFSDYLFKLPYFNTQDGSLLLSITAVFPLRSDIQPRIALIVIPVEITLHCQPIAIHVISRILLHQQIPIMLHPVFNSLSLMSYYKSGMETYHFQSWQFPSYTWTFNTRLYRLSYRRKLHNNAYRLLCLPSAEFYCIHKSKSYCIGFFYSLYTMSYYKSGMETHNIQSYHFPSYTWPCRHEPVPIVI